MRNIRIKNADRKLDRHSVLHKISRLDFEVIPLSACHLRPNTSR
jgi:hypothetical protein